MTYEKDAARVTPDTLFDIASLTKVVVTTTLAMILHERGLLDLESPVSRYVPEFEGEGKGPGPGEGPARAFRRSPVVDRLFPEVRGKDARRVEAGLSIGHPRDAARLSTAIENGLLRSRYPSSRRDPGAGDGKGSRDTRERGGPRPARHGGRDLSSAGPLLRPGSRRRKSTLARPPGPRARSTTRTPSVSEASPPRGPLRDRARPRDFRPDDAERRRVRRS